MSVSVVGVAVVHVSVAGGVPDDDGSVDIVADVGVVDAFCDCVVVVGVVDIDGVDVSPGVVGVGMQFGVLVVGVVWWCCRRCG